MDITFTLDLEDHRARPGDAPRHLDYTRRVLDFLAARSWHGTFFVIGDVAEEDPRLIREIAAGGHEVGLHGYRHVPLPEVGPEQFRREAGQTKAMLEDLIQQPLVGYRAPMFSLVPESQWVVDVLPELGFRYSSSVMPIRHPLYGDVRCPPHPFVWPSGLVELPCPVTRFGSFGLPYLGAVWVRVLPWSGIRLGLSRAQPSEVLWVYTHPYDFDPHETFRVLPEAGQIGSRLVWHRRDRMFARIEQLLKGHAAPPLGARLAALPAVLPAGPSAAVA